MALQNTELDQKTAGAVIAGLLLLLASQAALYAIPQGASEFAYEPFTPGPLPFSPMRGFTVEQLAEHAARVLLATPGLLLLTLGLARLVGAGRAAVAVPRDLHPRLALGAAVASLAYISWLLFFVYQGRAIIDDELAYRMQAMLLAEGRLGMTSPPLLYAEPFTIKALSGITGKYLFGEPLLQIPGALLGFPALLHLPLAALTLLCCYRGMKLHADSTVASWTVILLATSPTFLLSTPTGQSVSSSLCMVVLAWYGYTLVAYRGATAGALILGTAVGLGMTIRPQAMAPMGAVLVAAALWRLLRRKRLLPVALLLVSLGLWAASILAYNKLVTGAYLELPWFLIRPVERFGFGQVWDVSNYRHTLLTALQNLGVVLLRFNGWWLGWPCSLLLLWLWWRNGRAMQGAHVWVTAGVAVVLFEAGYYSTGVSDTGTVYHYELLVPAAALGANAVRQGLLGAPRFTVALLVVHFALGSVSFTAYHTMRVDRMVTAIHGDVDQALARVERPAVLYYDIRCSEVLRNGWVHSPFPRRQRSSYDSVVTYPKPPPDRLASHLALFPGRSCWYFRRNPADGKPELYRCDQARALMRRPYNNDKVEYCLSLKSTAELLGWYHPWEVVQETLDIAAFKKARNGTVRQQ